MLKNPINRCVTHYEILATIGILGLIIVEMSTCVSLVFYAHGSQFKIFLRLKIFN